MHINPKEGLYRVAAVNERCLFDFHRNGFYEAAEHKYRKPRTETKINNPDGPGGI